MNTAGLANYLDATIAAAAVTGGIELLSTGGVRLGGTQQQQFRDSGIGIHSQSDSNATFFADGSITLDAPTVTVSDGNLYVGDDDTVRGSVFCYGPDTGSAPGGRVILYTGADYDTVINYFEIRAYEDDLEFRSGTTDRLKYKGGEDRWEFAADAVMGAAKRTYYEAIGSTPGTESIYSPSNGNLHALADTAITLAAPYTAIMDSGYGFHIGKYAGQNRNWIAAQGPNSTLITSPGSVWFIYDSDDDGSNDSFTVARDGATDSTATVDLRITEGKVGIGTTTPNTMLEINGAADLGKHLLELDQDDDDEPFVKFDGTSAADQTKSISTANGDGAVDGPKNFSASAGWTFEGMVRVDINGTDYWMPYYSADTA